MNRFKFSGIIKLIMPILLIPLFIQCMHDEFDFDKLDDEMEIVFGILSPVAYGSLNMGDLISEFDSSSYISTDPDGLLLLTYQDSLISYVAGDLLEIPGQNFFEYFIESDFGFPVAPPVDTFEINRTVMFPFTFDNGEKLDSMILDAGSLIFDIASTFQHQAEVDIEIPNLKLNGSVFSQTFTISDESGSYAASIPFALDGYSIQLQDSVGTDTMFFPVEFHVEVYTNGVNTISLTDQIDIVANLTSLDFDAIFGYIGDYELLGENGEFDLGFFDTPLDGYIEFENPEINLNIINSYGVPAEININQFTGFDESGDSIQMIFNPTSASTFRYAFPSIDEYGETKDTTISINGDNSTVSEFLAFFPSNIKYNITAVSNPDGEGVNYNFVNDDSKIDVNLELILPLEFKADNFALTDTVEDILDEGWQEDADIIDKINIMLEVTNGMPLDVDFQITFMDASYNPVDTLFAEGTQPIIAAAIVDPVSHEVISSNKKTSLIQYSNLDIERIKDARHAIIRAGLKTPSVEGELATVKFFDYYTVDFNLSVGVNIKANTNDL
ncbi:MAG: hypothetical protein JEY96_14330 [Bacteroidales bacterium]|nr:hypothetical protein [Bacteroidales bacterium]